ncbi:alpha-soluble NSF attachment protein [Phlyctema vagabunda]|uniref:Alpha-soluble NSF attachment protein n=1 Tax=Phlyctema vagabunda TaxID=108571 RepID=A0ABR4PF50_9HELO
MSQTARAKLAQGDAEAHKAATRTFLWSRSDVWESAVEAYTKAGAEFRVIDEDNEAAAAFHKAADIQKDQLDSALDAASNYQECFKLYRKGNPEKAVECQTHAIDIYLRESPRRAGNLLEARGQFRETEIGDIPAALQDYEAAAKIFDRETNSQALANKLWLKVAEIAAIEGDYFKAIENFEKVAASAVSNNLLKWSVKEYFLKAGLCHLASGDMVATNRAFAKYRDMDPTFPSTREHQLLIDLAEAVQAGDQEMFADKLFKYDQISKLDKWKTTILLKIKNAIEDAGEDFS